MVLSKLGNTRQILLKLFDEVINLVDQEKSVNIVYLASRMVFDNVEHTLFLDKME